MPSVLYRDQLVIGNTLSSVTWSAMLAIGAIIGGIVAELFGIQTALIIDAGTFLLSALIVMTLTVPDTPRSEIGQEQRVVIDKAKRTFMDGIRYIRKNPATAAAIFVKAGQSFTSVDTILIIYGTSVFVLGEQGTTSMAILWSAFGVGAIIGPLITNRFSDESVRMLRRLIVVGYAMIVIGWVLWGLSPSLELLALAVVIRAMGSSINWTYSSIIIQKIVPDEYLGRMFSLDFAGFEMVMAVSVMITGILIDTIKIDNIQTIVFGFAIVAIIPLIIWSIIVQQLEQHETTNHGG
jgi:predicted MFS family arabinose efflux permease